MHSVSIHIYFSTNQQALLALPFCYFYKSCGYFRTNRRLFFFFALAFATLGRSKHTGAVLTNAWQVNIA